MDPRKIPEAMSLECHVSISIKSVCLQIYQLTRDHIAACGKKLSLSHFHDFSEKRGEAEWLVSQHHTLGKNENET